MTREEIIQGLQFTIDMFLLNPTTGETYTEPRNDMDKTTIDACKGAIKLLREESEKDEVILTKKEYGELVSSEFDNGYAKGFREALEQEPCEDAVSRQAVLNALDKRFDSIPVEQTIEILLLRKDLRELPPVTYYKVESEEGG